jgi:hypothetical protein
MYKVVNKLTGQYYLGVHSTDIVDDGYLGSGLRIKRAIKKHGKESFEREILEFFSSAKEMFSKEKEIIDESILNDPLSYNIKEGGKGGWEHLSAKRLSEQRKTWWSDPTNKELISAKAIRWAKENPDRIRERILKMNEKRLLMYGDLSWDKAQKDRISKGLRNYWGTGDIDEKKRKRSKETKGKMSDIAKKALSSNMKGYDNFDFQNRWKPFYDKLILAGIVSDLTNPDFLDKNIVEKYGGGFKLYRLINYLQFLGLIMVISTVSYPRKKTFCEIKGEKI